MQLVGWAAAEAIVSYLIPLWIGARGMEFSWEYIQMGLASNINLVRCALPPRSPAPVFASPPIM
jgi:hypothetical protein